MEPQPQAQGQQTVSSAQGGQAGQLALVPPCPPTTEEGVPREGPGPFSESLLGRGDKKAGRGEGSPSWWGPSGLPPGYPRGPPWSGVKSLLTAASARLPRILFHLL